MGKFSELDLKWYEEEDLEDLEAEYPGLFDKSREDLDKFATQAILESAESNRGSK